MTMILESDATETVRINELELDRECIRLPSSYLKYAHKAAEAKRDLAEAEAGLSVVQAELAKKVRLHPEVFGVDKVTETSVTEAVKTRESFKKATAAVTNAKYQCDLAQAVVWALEHKKRSLTLLVELHGMSYFSNPKISERGKNAVEQMTQRKVRRRDDE